MQIDRQNMHELQQALASNNPNNAFKENNTGMNPLHLKQSGSSAITAAVGALMGTCNIYLQNWNWIL